jgi:hypothetical protein
LGLTFGLEINAEYVVVQAGDMEGLPLPYISVMRPKIPGIVVRFLARAMIYIFSKTATPAPEPTEPPI